jgi:hypothetical protein
MATFLHDLGKAWLGVENVAFGTFTGNLARLAQLKGMPDRGNLKQVYHPSARLRTGNHQEPGVLGHYSDSTIALEMYLRGWSSSVPTNHPTLSSPLLSGATAELAEMVAVAQCIGQIEVSGGGAAFESVQAAPPPTTTAFSVVDGTKYTIGHPIAVDVSAGLTGTYEVRRIKNIAVNEITLDMPLSAAPQAHAVVYDGICIFPTVQPQIDSLSMVLQGEDFDGGNYWAHKLLGLYGKSCVLTMNAQGFVDAKCEYDVASWSRYDKTAAVLYEADTGPEREAVLGSKFTSYVSGGSIATIDVAGMEFNTGQNIIRPLAAGGNGVQGVGRSRYGLAEPLLTIDPFKETEAKWMSDLAPFRAQAGVASVFQAGTQPGRLIALCIPNGHVTEEPVLGNRDGLLTNQLKITPMVNIADGAGTDQRSTATPIDAPWCLAIL